MPGSAPIYFHDLENLHLPHDFIQRWTEELNQRLGRSESDYPLTAFQSFLLGHPITLSSQENLVVAGPTSAGKTLVAQSILVNTLTMFPGGKAIYLVPLRALVTEKYNEFSSTLCDSRITPCSSDYPLCDRIITSGHWDVAIAVFDKVYQWLTTPKILRILLNDVRLLLVDEFQVIEAAERGEKLEILLSFFRWFQSHNTRYFTRPLRIVSMLSSPEVALPARAWLGAHMPVRQHTRPVKLYEGWLSTNNTFELYLDGADRQAVALDACPEKLKKLLGRTLQANPFKSTIPLMKKLCAACIREQLRALVYVASKREAETLALQLSQQLLRSGIRPVRSSRLRSELEQLDESPIKALLAQTLRAGVGLHHGNMTQFERSLVERNFTNSGEGSFISLVVATPTLSMGVNLPADVVIMKDQHTHGGIEGVVDPKQILSVRTNERMLTTLEYKNFAGRAGRYRPGEDDRFGLSIMLLDERNIEKLKKRITPLLHGQHRALRSGLMRPAYGYHPHLLVLLAALEQMSLPHSIQQALQEILHTTYVWSLETKAQPQLQQKFSRAEKQLLSSDLVRNYIISAPGRVVATHHVSLEGAGTLLKTAQALPELWPLRRLELLYLLASIPEMANKNPWKNSLPLESKRLAFIGELRSYLMQRITPRQYAADSIFGRLVEAGPGLLKEISDEEIIRLAVTLLAWEWTSGRPVTRIRSELPQLFMRLNLRQAETIGRLFAFYISALRGLWEVSIPAPGAMEQWQKISLQLWQYELSLRYGIPAGACYLPIMVSVVSNQVLPRRAYLQVWAEFGPWSNLVQRSSEPPPISILPYTWEVVQRCIGWWQGKSPQDLAKAMGMLAEVVEADGLAQAIEEPRLPSEKLLDELGLIPAPISEEGEAEEEAVALVEPVDDQTRAAIRQYAKNRLAGMDLDDIEVMYPMVRSALDRTPILGLLQHILLPAAEKYPPGEAPNKLHRLLSELKLGSHSIFVALIAAQPGFEDFIPIPKTYKGLLVICNELPEPEIRPRLASKVRLWLTVESLYAAAELVERDPTYLPRFQAVLAAYRGVLADFDQFVDVLEFGSKA